MSPFLPDGADRSAHSQFRRKEITPAANAKPFGGYSAFTIAGISAFAFHGAAFGQTNAPEILFDSTSPTGLIEPANGTQQTSMLPDMNHQMKFGVKQNGGM